MVQATVSNTKLHSFFSLCQLRLFLLQVTETQLKLVPAKSFWFVIEKFQDGFRAWHEPGTQMVLSGQCWKSDAILTLENLETSFSYWYCNKAWWGGLVWIFFSPNDLFQWWRHIPSYYGNFLYDLLGNSLGFISLILSFWGIFV